MRTGSTASQKSLFFNLKRVKSQIEREFDTSVASVDYGSLNKMVAEDGSVSKRRRDDGNQIIRWRFLTKFTPAG